MLKILGSETHVVLRTTRVDKGDLVVETKTIGKPPQANVAMDVGPDVISHSLMTVKVIFAQQGLNRLTLSFEPEPVPGASFFYGYAVEFDAETEQLIGAEGGAYVAHPSGVLSHCGADANIVDPPVSQS